MQAVLDIKNLRTEIRTRAGIMRVINDVSLHVGAGEAVALVGESGCGKSMTALSVLRLADPRTVSILDGEVIVNGQDLTRLSNAQMRQVRGRDVSMVFQDPMTFLNPVMDIGSQVANPLKRHLRLKGVGLESRVLELLDLVRLPDPRKVARSFPHELSGGQRQRVLIAIALACSPKLVIADEPTTALDVTIQAQVLEVLQSSLREFGTSLLMITHNMGIVAGMCDRVYVMYAGKIVEHGLVEDVFASPRHPYSQGLLGSVLRHDRPNSGFKVMGGSVPNLIDPPQGCRFRPRCPQAMDVCKADPAWIEFPNNRGAACWLYDR